MAVASVAQGFAEISPGLHRDDDEWEYEYDADETDHVYFTLDLTNHDLSALQVKEVSLNGKPKPIVMTAPTDPPIGEGLGLSSTRESSTTNTNPDIPVQDAKPIQILDLHTPKPYVKFGTSIYSCYWTTDLGSQFYVSRPGIVEDPLRPGNVVDVIALSRARLIGKPVALKQRVDFREGASHQGSASSNAIAIDDDDEPGPVQSTNGNLQDYGPGKELVVPLELITDSASEQQASFLERLSAIKVKRGETDLVPTNAVRYYQPPRNIKEIRERALAADAEKAKARGPTKLPEAPPLKRRRSPSDGPVAGAGKGGRPTNTKIKSSLGFQDDEDDSG
ncbi:Hypothetical protein R9X50_00328500 [Acrodontium crateriforme]|uniref:Transcription factor TFIIIC triple barrel domain-containing protein n=1 Tax=Acrodontium crateriforme TaxID=150365 RepID=A0AAQ3R446_9PEZI|nr:Hypothetical protein R9X50_00328500 [Acrodontium crateriforme]